MKIYAIATMPGDGIGKEVVPAGAASMGTRWRTVQLGASIATRSTRKESSR
jgi:isocitrate/isopropylmalate dehydrogenase